MQYPAVYICVCSIYLPELYMRAQIRVWSFFFSFSFSFLLTPSLFTEIAACKFLRGLAVVWPETFIFCPLYVCIHFLPLLVWRIVP